MRLHRIGEIVLARVYWLDLSWDPGRAMWAVWERRVRGAGLASG